MRKQEFIDALYKCGWDSPHDAQHAQIAAFWAKLFPAVKRLEDDLEDLQNDFDILSRSYEEELKK
jgi:hypothetical protein